MKRQSGTRQRGVVIVQVVIALVALLGVAALAIDLGRAYLNKTRLQNAVDAAALAGAKVLAIGQSEAAARTAGEALFGQNRDHELADADIDLNISFYDSLSPLTPSSDDDGPFVRVAASGLELGSLFARVVGIDSLSVAASAVAGPSGPVNPCNLAPVLICGDASSATNFGLALETVYSLTMTPKQLKEGDILTPSPGAGNWQLVRLEGLSGANDFSESLAGIDRERQCQPLGATLETEPGVSMGPVKEGVNSRILPPCTLNPKSLCSDFNVRPDLVSATGISYSTYLGRYQDGNFDTPDGAPNRRILVVPIGNCDPMIHGQSTLPVLGYGCFFLREAVDTQGTILGEFISECDVQGEPGTAGGGSSISNMRKVVLHDDPLSDDS